MSFAAPGERYTICHTFAVEVFDPEELYELDEEKKMDDCDYWITQEQFIDGMKKYREGKKKREYYDSSNVHFVIKREFEDTCNSAYFRDIVRYKINQHIYGEKAKAFWVDSDSED